MAKQITSRSNPLIKELARLKTRVARKESGLALIEGERFVCEMASRGIEFAYLLYVERPAVADEIKAEEIECTREVIEVLSQTVSPSLVVGVVRLEKCDFMLPKGNFLVLDRIQDPGNLGTIVRTALAFDFRDIYMYNCVDWTNDKVLRSTMGTIADVRLYECDLSALERLKGYPLFGADMDGEKLEDVHSDGIVGVALGNEANGLGTEVLSLCNRSVAIPMKNGVESLNVAVAGAIIMNKMSN